MTWLRWDDKFHGHRKARRAWKEPRALGLHLLASCYTADHMLDGFVDEEFVEEKLPTERERERVTTALVGAGLWERAENGFQIHDFLEYNPSRIDVLARRGQDADRKAAAREAARLRRESAGSPGGQTADSAPTPPGVGGVSALSKPDPTRPDPTRPDPTRTSPDGEAPPTPQGGECVPSVKIDGKVVRPGAWERTVAVVAEFNAQAGRKVGALTGTGQPSETGKRVYLRVVEFPDLTLDDHADIIRRTLSSKWWGDDPATVGVVYGPKVFENNITRTAQKQRGGRRTPPSLKPAPTAAPAAAEAALERLRVRHAAEDAAA